MENIFRYYEFSGFLKDNSGTFQENEISFSELNKEHFLIFEKKIHNITCTYQNTAQKRV
nr:hypothetical protein BACY1_03570 [Tenacibaculum mesophilum]